MFRLKTKRSKFLTYEQKQNIYMTNGYKLIKLSNFFVQNKYLTDSIKCQPQEDIKIQQKKTIVVAQAMETKTRSVLTHAASSQVATP